MNKAVSRALSYSACGMHPQGLLQAAGVSDDFPAGGCVPAPHRTTLARQVHTVGDLGTRVIVSVVTSEDGRSLEYLQSLFLV